MYRVINKENMVEENPQSPLDDKAMEYLVAPPLKEHKDEDSSHTSIEDQAHEEIIIEETSCSAMEYLVEDLKYESPHVSISPPHEVEGLVRFAPYQTFEFDGLPCYDLERGNLEDKTSNDDEVVKACISPFDEDNGTLGHGVIDITFHIFYRDMKPNVGYIMEVLFMMHIVMCPLNKLQILRSMGSLHYGEWCTFTQDLWSLFTKIHDTKIQ